ncbi:unnamed protein product [Enterobius vermicularis]|uniref:Autophagy-related protein 2 n=1 Tax=Enterobius vermicularis TaxID=51028 RepID=A0A158QB02_ENTVE|nr:unnamed protein product [Enterobius vermicularis]
MSLIDRISSLLVRVPFYKGYSFSSDKSSWGTRPLYSGNSIGSGVLGIQESQEKICFILKCPVWTVNVRFPAVFSLSERIPYWMSHLRNETLRLEFHNVVLELPVSEITQLCRLGRVTLSASELLGFFFGVNSVSQFDGDDMEFLYASCRRKEQGDGVRIQFDYDFRDSSLEDGKLNECLKETSSEELVGGFKRELDHESLNSDQGASFLKKEDVVSCAANGDSPFSVDVTFYEGGEVKRVGKREELSAFGNRSTKHSHLRIKVFTGYLKLQLPSHHFCEVLYNRLVNDFALWEWSSPLLKQFFSSRGERLADDSEKSDKGKSLETTTGDSANVFVSKPSVKEMNVCIEPNSSQDVPYELVVDDNVAIALHSSYEAGKNFKNTVVAFSLKNSTCHIEPFSNSGNRWVTKLVDFLKIEDYLVEGYSQPSIDAEIHVHLASTTLACSHLDSETSLKFLVGSSDLSCNISSNSKRYKFGCILEESSLLLGTCGDRSSKVSSGKSSVPQTRPYFVKLVSLDNLNFEVLADGTLFDQDSSSAERMQTPCKVTCSHGSIKLYACADSLTLFLNLLLSAAEAKQSGTASTSSSNSPQPPDEGSFGSAYHPDLEVGSLSNGPSLSDETNTSFPKDENCTDLLCEDFLLIGVSSGSGIMSSSQEEPQVHLYDKENEGSLDVDVGFIEIPNEKNYMMPSKIKSMTTSVMCTVQDLSLELHFFGGNDFGPERDQEKAYSDKAFRSGQGCDQRVLEEEKGGPYRDYSVHVVFELSKMNYEYGFIKSATPLNYHYFTVKNIEVRNRLRTSRIDKLMLQYSSAEVPRRDSAPILAVRLVENQRSEAKLRVSLLPLRLYLDVDTLEFLYDFFTEALSFFTSSGYVVTESAARQEKILSRRTVSSSHSASEIYVEDFNAKSPPLIQSNDSTGHLSGEKGSKPMMNLDYVGSSSLPNRDFSSSLLSYEPGDKGIGSIGSAPTVEQQNSDAEGSSCYHLDSKLYPPLDERRFSGSDLQREDGLYFKEFTFSPSVLIRLDFDSQRVVSHRGALVTLITALTNLQCAEIILRDLHNVDGMVGIKRCIDFAFKEWTRDIGSNQYTQLISSYAPLSTLVQLGKGLKDLLVMPVDEYRKEDGHVVRGLQRGAQSFGFSTAAALVDVTRKMFGGIQGLAEFALSVVSTERSSSDMSSKRISLAGQGRPSDLKQGFHMALETAKEGVLALQKGAEQSTSIARGPVGYIREFPPALLGTVAVGTKMAVQLLDGLKSQLEPAAYQ